MMSFNQSTIPVAVIVALVIFFLKEIIEWVRRERANGRKRHAIKHALAAECQRNEFAIRRLADQIKNADEASSSERQVVIIYRKNDAPRIQFSLDDHISSSPIPSIHTAYLEKYMFEAASLDGGLFELMEETYDALLEARHVRDSLVTYVSEEPEHLDGFREYADDELDLALDKIRELYLKCKLEPLAQGRVR